jgi:hypothetical protein
MEQKRGQLTERIKAKSLELMGYEIDKTELRLMPYIIYVMMNDQKIDPNKVNGQERDILRRWKMRGWIDGGACGMNISVDFWNILCSIVLLGYVDLSE